MCKKKHSEVVLNAIEENKIIQWQGKGYSV